MPALKPTSFTGKIIWLGRVPNESLDIRSVGLKEAFAGFAGIDGERHGGLTRPACVRTSAQYKPGTTIRNVRQFSILSGEELDAIAGIMGGESIDPLLLGATMIVEGIPDFSHVPPSSRLQTTDGTSLVVDMENRPCVYPGKEIDKDTPGYGTGFKAAAKGLRGVTAWVEREGNLRVGDSFKLHIPDQPVWHHFDEARN
ncbi:MAG: sulfurase [Paracoccaceae bacterium]